MSRNCLDMDALSDLLEAGPDDPRHAHVRSCVRCRNQMESLRAFRSPESGLPADEVAHAEQRMAAALDRAVSGTEEPVQSPFARARTGLFGGPWWRPALGAAAVVMIVFAASQIVERGAPPPSGVVRGDAAEEPLAIVLQPPSVLADGRLHLAWEAHPEADAYRVVFLDLHLEELRSLSAGPETSVTLDTSVLRTMAPAGEQILWRVAALRRGVEIGGSPSAGVALP